jgi:hypothetical protein
MQERTKVPTRAITPSLAFGTCALVPVRSTFHVQPGKRASMEVGTALGTAFRRSLARLDRSLTSQNPAPWIAANVEKSPIYKQQRFKDVSTGLKGTQIISMKGTGLMASSARTR